MDDAGAVRVAQRVGHLARDLERVADRELPLPREPLPQRLALDVGHDVEDQAIHLVGVVQRQDVRVMQPGRDLDLAQEPGGADFGGQLGAKHFDRDVTLVLEVVGQEDLGHPALPKLPLEPIAGRQRRAEAFEQLCHSWLDLPDAVRPAGFSGIDCHTPAGWHPPTAGVECRSCVPAAGRWAAHCRGFVCLTFSPI